MAWLQRWLPRPSARLRLLCLPYAGGSAGAYRDWVAGLPADVELLAAELPGHGRRYGEPFAESIDQVVDAVLGELTPLLTRPLVVYGHSMGALLALELARGIRNRTQRPPAALLVSGSDFPSVPIAGEVSDPELLPDSYWRAALRDYGGVDEHCLTDDRLMEAVVSVLRGDLALLGNHSYHDQEPLRCPVRVYAGISDHTVSAAGLAAWRRESPHDFRITRLPGGHFYLRDCAQLQLARLAQDLTEIPTAIPGVVL